MNEMEHFDFTIDRVGVARINFDRQGESVNTLAPDVLGEFDEILQRCETDAAVRAVVLTSGKRDSFVVGGDLRWLKTLDDPTASRELILVGQQVLFRLEKLWGESGKPVVAAVHGTCLGGGLEVAMACRHIVATKHDSTRFGQPEVKVGLIPGAGGTQRLPRRVGVAAALDLILTGRSQRAGRALSLGLVDELCDPDDLYATARDKAVRLIGAAPGKGRRRRRGSGVATALLESNAMGRRLIYGKAEKTMLRATKGLYPAQPAALRAIRAGVERGPKAGFAVEAEEFAGLLASPEAAGLISLFFAMQQNKAGRSGSGEDISQIAVIGGGLMGSGIASVSVTRAQIPTVVTEVDAEASAKAVAHIEKQIEISARKTRRPTEGYRRLLTSTTEVTDVKGAGLVIEAVFEDLALKKSILAAVEDATGGETVFATNTSSIPIADITSEARRPGNVVGMHYFSPVEKMPLLEVIATEQSTDEAIALAVEVGRRQGKTVIVVSDGPGFYTTRALAPYGAEVMHLITDGATIEDIDGAMVEWGFPVGPLTLNDEVGLDVAAKIAPIMVEAFGERMSAPGSYETLVADGRKGRKNGRGFYEYLDGKRGDVDQSVYGILGVTPDGSISRDEIWMRLSSALINEAALCLEEGVLSSAVDGDLGAVMGFGFPPFRGGPFFYVDQIGAGAMVERLEGLQERHGNRFEPAQILREHALRGERFRP